MTFRLLQPLEPRHLFATLYVSPDGDDANAGTDPAAAWRTIQKAFDSAVPGDTVLVQPGVYREKLTLNVSGDALLGAVRFVADGAVGNVVISGKGVKGANLVHIVDRSFVTIEGFELRDNTSVRDGSGIRVEGDCEGIDLLNNRIRKIRGRNAMGITIYGDDAVNGIRDLTIDGNEVFKCQAAPSEALTLNGNVYDFAVTNNYVHDVNNIGIDFIGGEGISPDPATDQVRDGICAGNRVERARSNYGGGYAAGIYVDGGKNIVIERNVVTQSDLGIEVGCENADRTAENITVRNNLLFDNVKAGIGIGGYAPQVGRVINSVVQNNTICHNARKPRAAGGEIRVQLGSGNVIENNIVVGVGRRPVLVRDENDPAATPANTLDYNLYFADAPRAKPAFVFGGDTFATLADYVAASGREAASVFADPLIAGVALQDFNLTAGSPAIDAGNPTFVPATDELDLSGRARVVGSRVDLGANEAVPG